MSSTTNSFDRICLKLIPRLFVYFTIYLLFFGVSERGWWACTSGKRIGLASIQTGIVGVDRPSPPRGSGLFLFYVFDFVGEGRHCKMLKEK
jgi:hypothetical protein